MCSLVILVQKCSKEKKLYFNSLNLSRRMIFLKSFFRCIGKLMTN